MFPQYLQVRGLKDIGFDKNEDCMTEQLSGLRHYIRIGMILVQTPLGTPSRLNLIMKLFLIFK